MKAKALPAVMKGQGEGPAPVCSSPRPWVDIHLLLCGYLADIVSIVLREPELAVGAQQLGQLHPLTEDTRRRAAQLLRDSEI